jgi:hypothetical protein
MGKVSELFTRGEILFLALMLVVAPFVLYDFDSRIGMILVGVVFGLSGVGHFRASYKETFARGLRKSLGIFLILFGFFTVAAMVVMFFRGEHLSSTPP